MDEYSYGKINEIKRNFEGSNKYILHIDYTDILYLFECIEKQQKENKILKELLYEIRIETRALLLSEIEGSSQENRPIKGTIKQEVYRAFEKIKNLVLGQYYYLDNNAAIKEVINDRIFMED